MAPKTRAELLAEVETLRTAPLSAADAPAPEAPDAGAEEETPTDAPSADATADAAVSEALAALSDAIDAAITAQEADPDKTDPNDTKVAEGLQAIKAQLATVMESQSADAEDSASTTPPASPADGDAMSAASMSEAYAAVAEQLGEGVQQQRILSAAQLYLDGLLTDKELTRVLGRFAAGDGTPEGQSGAGDGAKPGNANGVPGDADDSPPAAGDVPNGETCDNPDCGHLSELHADLETGANTGPCSSPDCKCPGFVPNATQVNGPDAGTPQGAPAEGGDGAAGGDDGEGDSAAAAVRAADAPPAPAADAAAPAPPAAAPVSAPASGDTLPPPDPEPNAAMQGPAFCIPVGIIEGMPTGDGRAVAEGALDWLDPPLPLMALLTATHDPSGFDENDPAEWVGSIEQVMRRPDDNGVLMALGHMFTTDEALDATQMLQQAGRMPISADVGGRAGRPIEVDSVLDGIMPELPPGVVVLDDGTMEMPDVIETLTQGTILGFTIVPSAAFEDCFIVLGDGEDQPPIGELVNRTPAPAPAPGQGEEEAPAEGAPAEAPAPVPVLAAMHFLIHAEECEPCATGQPVVASGGPVAPPRAWFEPPAFGHGADDVRLRETVDDKTGRLTGKYACPPTVTEDGRVFMHLAQWGVCHTSPQYKGACMLAPKNSSGYAYWHGGGSILTAEGELVDVGPITLGTGHARPSFGIADTLAHYDNTGTAVAYGTIGDDEHGIWFAGALAPDATPEQVFKLRASVPSGDWRPRGNRHELVACLMVNRGGFPQARAHSVNGRITSLVAAGAPAFEAPPVAPRALSIEERMAAFEAAVGPILPGVKADLEAEMATLLD